MDILTQFYFLSIHFKIGSVTIIFITVCIRIIAAFTQILRS